MVARRALRPALLTGGVLFLSTVLLLLTLGWLDTNPGFYLLRDHAIQDLVERPEICLMDGCVRSQRPLLCFMDGRREDLPSRVCTREPLHFRLLDRPVTITWPIRPGQPI